jgi:hypothetical protein
MAFKSLFPEVRWAVLWIHIGFNAGPDHLKADPDPGSKTNADPDPGQTLPS